jgi:KaiC/GvpD/RAD55 family RecA-like ATPase
LSVKSQSSRPTRPRISTGNKRLDEALHGGFPLSSGVVLSSPANDEVPILLRNYLTNVASERSVLISRSLSSAETIAPLGMENVTFLVCGSVSSSPAPNVLPGKGIENLTELNLQISEVLRDVQPKRVVIDILSDVLLRHKALQTRKWTDELLAKLRSRGITTLALINPNMHSREDVEAVVGLFDGNLEIAESDVGGVARRVLRVKWMHGVDVAEKEFPLEGARKTKERIDDLSEKLDVIANRLTTIEAILASGRESSDLAGILRGLRAGVALYNQPVQALKRLYDAQSILEQESLEKDEISRLIVEALAVHGSMNISQLAREIHTARGSSSRRIVRERVGRLVEKGTIRPSEGPGKRYELAK